VTVLVVGFVKDRLVEPTGGRGSRDADGRLSRAGCRERGGILLADAVRVVVAGSRDVVLGV